MCAVLLSDLGKQVANVKIREAVTINSKDSLDQHSRELM